MARSRSRHRGGGDAIAETFETNSTWIYAIYGLAPGNSLARATGVMACAQTDACTTKRYNQYYPYINVWIEPVPSAEKNVPCYGRVSSYTERRKYLSPRRSNTIVLVFGVWVAEALSTIRNSSAFEFVSRSSRTWSCLEMLYVPAGITCDPAWKAKGIFAWAMICVSWARAGSAEASAPLTTRSPPSSRPNTPTSPKRDRRIASGIRQPSRVRHPRQLETEMPESAQKSRFRKGRHPP